MRLYIDIENIRSFIMTWKKVEDVDARFEIKNFIKKELDVYVNSVDDEQLNDEFIQFWISCMMGGDGLGHSEKKILIGNKRFPPRFPFKSNFYKTLTKEDLSSIYLLDEDMNKCTEAANKGAVLVGCVHEEINVLNKIMTVKHGKVQLSSKISSWKDFCPELPLTDIVLIDPYYFCDYDQVSSNELIRSITLIPQNNPINIVLFCKKEADRGIDIMKEMQYIKETVKRNTSTKPNVTIVRMNDMHDRDLITNYFILSSGCGFDLQKKEIRINEKVTLYSMAYKQECGDTYNRMLCEYQESISKGKGEIIGDKKSNFLIF